MPRDSLNKLQQAKLLLASGRYDHLTLSQVAREVGLGYSTIRAAARKLKTEAKTVTAITAKNNTNRG